MNRQIESSVDRDEYGARSLRLSIPTTIALLPARTFFLLASQALFALIFQFRHYAQPWRNSIAWRTVYGTLADLGCLALLITFTHRQGLRFARLSWSVNSRRIQNSCARVVYFLLVMPVYLAGFVLSSYAMYGDPVD